MPERKFPAAKPERYDEIMASLLKPEMRTIPADIHPAYAVLMHDANLTSRDIVNRVRRVLKDYVAALQNPSIIPAIAPDLNQRLTTRVVGNTTVTGYGEADLATVFSHAVGPWVDVDQLIWTGKLICCLLLDYDRVIQGTTSDNAEDQQTIREYVTYWLTLAHTAGHPR